MNSEELKDRLATATLDIKRAINHDLPKIIGNKVVSMVKQNLQTESYFGEAWQEVQRRMFRRYKTKKRLPVYSRPQTMVCKNSRYIKKKSRGHRLSAIASKGVLSIFRPQKYN